MNSSTNVFDSPSSRPIEQAAAFPHRPADRDLLLHHLEDTGRVDAHVRLFRDDGRQRAPALEADLEANVRRGRASRLSAARCEMQTAITRGIRRLTAKSSYGSSSASARAPTCRCATFRNARDGIVGDRIPRQQRDDVRNQRGRQFFVPPKHARGRDRDRAIEAGRMS